MTSLIELSLSAFSVVLQLIAAYLGYRIYCFTRLSKWWLAVVIGFILQAIRRIFTFLEDFGAVNIPNTILIDRALMFLISLFMVIGLWIMLKNFENYDVVERQVKQKIQNFKKKR